jgi:hypothetical protein
LKEDQTEKHPTRPSSVVITSGRRFEVRETLPRANVEFLIAVQAQTPRIESCGKSRFQRNCFERSNLNSAVAASLKVVDLDHVISSIKLTTKLFAAILLP